MRHPPRGTVSHVAYLLFIFIFMSMLMFMLVTPLAPGDDGLLAGRGRGRGVFFGLYVGHLRSRIRVLVRTRWGWIRVRVDGLVAARKREKNAIESEEGSATSCQTRPKGAVDGGAPGATGVLGAGAGDSLAT